MADYRTGHVKRDPATGAVAIRTVWDEVGPHAIHTWGVFTTGSGAVTKITSEVDHWDDIYTPHLSWRAPANILLPNTPSSDI